MFLNFKDTSEAPYTDKTVFSQDKLLTITPEDIVAWFNFRAYGKSVITPEDNPRLCRSTSLMFWKKAISFFMPERNWKWSVRRGESNPTMLRAVLDMIQAVRKKEVRGLGAPSKARSAFSDPQYKFVMEQFEHNDNIRKV